MKLAQASQMVGFQSSFLDFHRGIRVGNLGDHERITRILKVELESRFQQPFVTERWGRGVYWRWIGYVVKANKLVKPISSNVSFGCAKFFLMIDTDEQLFKCGLQVERGYLKKSDKSSRFNLETDWDWHRLIKLLRSNSPMETELKRLVLRESFTLQAGSWSSKSSYFSKSNFPTMLHLRKKLKSASEDDWASFMVYFSMKEDEILQSSGNDIVDSILAIFEEVTPAMKLCIQTAL